MLERSLNLATKFVLVSKNGLILKCFKIQMLNYEISYGGVVATLIPLFGTCLTTAPTPTKKCFSIRLAMFKKSTI